MIRDDLHGLEEAERIGYPVLIKPSAGGGGKGMRMVRTPRELEAALKICRSEARAAFGDDSLYLEKWLEDNRHVEVQVAVDRFGHGVHLGERDCSVQRRHQKFLEEAPTPALGEAARNELAERAIKAVVAAGYENVGTLEFLVDPPATPTSSRSTAGSRSSIRSPRCSPGSTSSPPRSGSPRASHSASARPTSTLRGHALEFRINAEDTEHDFRPSTGTVERYLVPGGPGVRMDSHLFTGYEVPPYLRLAAGQADRVGPRPADGDRPFAGRARRARRRGPGHEHRDPPGAPGQRHVPGRRDDDEPRRSGRLGSVPCRRGAVAALQTCTESAARARRRPAHFPQHVPWSCP